MTISDIHNHLETIGESGHDIWMSQPVGEAAIQSLESLIGYRLPDSVKDYLMEFGALGINDTVLSGILKGDPYAKEPGTILGDTATFQREGHGQPEGYIVIQKHEDGAYCLDFSKGDGKEVPVVNVQRKTEARVASSFSEFLTEYLIEPWLLE